MNKNDLFYYAKTKYNTIPDYPWSDDSAVLRHKENRKMYGLIMEVLREKLGLTGEGKVTVLNVKSDPMMVSFLKTQEGFHPAYHMNKEKWLSIRLDGTVSEEQIRQLVDLSYELTKTKIIHRHSNTSDNRTQK